MIEPGEIDNLFIDLSTRLVKFKKEFAMEFQQRVEHKTPVLTGALKKGWITKTTQTGFNISNIMPYASYVENGTPFMAPRAMIALTVVEIPQITKVVKERLGIK